MAKAASKGKIANKVSSKKNKKSLSVKNQKNLQNSDKYTIGSKNDAIPKATLNRSNKKKTDAEKAKDQIREISHRIETEEIELPEDDMISTDDESEEINSMAFLDGLSQSRQIEKLEKERKRRINNMGEEFEVNNRSFKTEDDINGEKKRKLLPVVNPATGKMEDRYAQMLNEEMDDAKSDSENDDVEEGTPDELDKALTEKDIIQIQQEMNQTWPKRLANAANRAMAQPEQHAHAAIRCFMQAMSFDGDNKYMPVRLRQMAMLTCGAVLVDVLPSYKIAKLSEVQMKEKVKKDLKILRAYEQGLLDLYQKYLMKLEYFLKLYRNPGLLKSTKRIQKRRKQANEEEIDVLHYLSSEARLMIARTVAKVFSKLMVNTVGFNYHDNILETAIPLLNDKDDQIRAEIESGSTELFKVDKLGEKTLKVVQKVAKLVREKSHKTEPICIEIFLKLRIKQVEQRQGKDEKDKDRKKIDRNQVSRAQNKQRKKEAKLAKEMVEMQAAENQQDRLYYNSRIIEAIFGIYFRVLKSARKSPLLPPSLLGVAQFGHLINLDLIGPLLKLLENVFSDADIAMHSRLKAAKSACTILSGQGEDLLVDPKHLYQNTFILLNNIDTTPQQGTSDPWPILFDLLINLMVDRKNHLNNGRVNAFLHRIITTAVRINGSKDSSHFVLPLLLIVRQIIIHHRCTRTCLDDEAELSSLPLDETDPDLVLANRVAVTKELKVLAESKNRYIQALARHLIDGAPSKGQVLPKNMGRKKPSDLYRELRYKK